jgi:hypothetical protein
MSRNVSKEWCFHHTRNYSTQLVKWWPATGRRLWLPCLSTGRRDRNGYLRTMVITIHKLPVGSFTFLQCLLETEPRNLSGTAYISTLQNGSLDVPLDQLMCIIPQHNISIIIVA